MLISPIVMRKYVIPAACLFLFFSIIIAPLCVKAQLGIDEVLDSDPAYNLAFKHKMIWSVHGSTYRTDESYFIRPPLYPMILAGLYKIFGFKRWVTLSLSFVPAILAFCVIYAMAMFLTKDFLASIMSSLLFGLGAFGISMAKWGRTDALAFLLFVISMFIFLLSYGQENKYLRNILLFCSGILMGLCAQVYQIYGLLFMSFVFYYLLELRLKSTYWFKEMLIFSVAFFASLILWLSFILKDIEAFKLQTTYAFFSATGLRNLDRSNFLMQNLKDIYDLLLFASPVTSLFFVIGSLFFIKQFPRSKNMFISFILMPVLFLFLSHTFKNNYVEVFLPLGFIGMGFFVAYLFRRFRLSLSLNNKKRAVVFGGILIIFLLSHLATGLGARYVLTIKDWKIRNLPVYESGLISFIPPGSVVLGNPEDWYALAGLDSRLLLMLCTYDPAFNWRKIDFVIVPASSEIPLSVSRFIKDRCVELGRVGVGAYDYKLFDNNVRHSGYASVIFKVKDKSEEDRL